MFQKFACLFGLPLLLAIAIARIAVWLQRAGFSTVVLFPLIIGTVLGAIVGFVASQTGETNRKLAVVVALLAAAVCAAAEHGIFYLDYRRGFEAKLQSDPNARLAATMNPELFEPVPLAKYMVSEWAMNWRLWILDALAMIGAAGTAAWFVFGSCSGAPRGDTSAAINSDS
jgi:hypothetical protein